MWTVAGSPTTVLQIGTVTRSPQVKSGPGRTDTYTAEFRAIGAGQAVLDAKGVKYYYIEHGSYLSGWKPRTALKMWTGWPTFPMIFVKGALIGGATDLARLMETGELERLLKA